VLNGHGVTDVKSAADAAQALVPLVSGFPHAGFIAEAIFAVGIIGLGLISVPVLACSAGYAVAEALNWNEGLAKRVREAHGFYGVITLATVVGLVINFVGIDPIKALVVTSVINAVVAIPLVWIIISISSDKKIMGSHRSGPLSKTLLWLTLAALILSAGAMVWTAVGH
jgi:Mn2+/Fe2+ NRAMP family transporter